MRTRWAVVAMVAAAAVPGPPAAAATTAPRVVALLHDDEGSRIVAGRLGGTLRTVHRGTRLECPSLSPGGGRIAFNESQAGGRRIGVMRVDGTGLRYLTAASDRVEPCNFVWSPAGHRLYYGDLYGRTQATYRIATDGSSGRVRIPGSDGTQPASVRTDGAVLAVSAYSPTSAYNRTELLRVDGSRRRVVTPDNYALPVWSPDGRYLATHRILTLDFDNGHATRIYLVDPATGARRGLTATGSANEPGISRQLAWTPDSKALYYLRYRDGPAYWTGARLYRIGADGTGRVDLTPAWGPGYLAFVSVQRALP